MEASDEANTSLWVFNVRNRCGKNKTFDRNVQENNNTLIYRLRDVWSLCVWWICTPGDVPGLLQSPWTVLLAGLQPEVCDVCIEKQLHSALCEEATVFIFRESTFNSFKSLQECWRNWCNRLTSSTCDSDSGSEQYTVGLSLDNSSSCS